MQRPTHAGLRHLALNVRDLPAMRRFYVDLLGFAVEWEPDPDNIYLSSGIDNLALHKSGGRESADKGTGVGDRSISDSRPLAQTLDHLGVIVRSADEVDQWAAFLESHGVTIDAKPRTHRDGARSCYFRDPDGNKVQVIHHPPISGRI